jgi:hypothetical protein
LKDLILFDRETKKIWFEYSLLSKTAQKYGKFGKNRRKKHFFSKFFLFFIKAKVTFSNFGRINNLSQNNISFLALKMHVNFTPVNQPTLNCNLLGILIYFNIKSFVV